MHGSEHAARGIGLYVISGNTEFLRFNQDGAISSLNSKSLELIDQFIHLGRNISSTESDVTIRRDRERTAIDRLMTNCKSDLC